MIKKDAFGGTYFRDIYSCVTGKFNKNSWKEFKELKDIDSKYYCSDFYDVNLNCYGVKVGASLRFWEEKGWINKLDPYGWFQWYFRYWKGRRSNDDIRQINRWKRIVNRFSGILNKLISKGKDSKKLLNKFYFIGVMRWRNHQLYKVWFSSFCKIFPPKAFFNFFNLLSIKMDYYRRNRGKINIAMVVEKKKQRSITKKTKNKSKKEKEKGTEKWIR